MNTINCPCGNNKSYQECCQRIHDNIALAETAEELMRSRYCAFTKGMGEYLIKSHHFSTRDIVSKEELEHFANSVKWQYLNVIESTKGSVDDSEGFVEFKAHFRKGISKKVIHEKSRFLKENGIWYYVEAV